MLFVYVKGLRGPEPQKWDPDMTVHSETGKPRERLYAVELPPKQWKCSLDVLAVVYPYPYELETE